MKSAAMDMPTYLVDFDGVICDSRQECLITSHAAYRRAFFGRKEAFAAAAIAPEAGSRFVSNRYLARTAREFALLWDLIDAARPIDEDEWEQVRSTADEARLARFHDVFYSTRYEWMRQDLPGWISTHRFFPEMRAALMKWLAQGRAHIVSSKDSRSIMALLEHHGIEIAESMVGGCEGGDKIEHFRRLRETNSGELAFIDDNIDNLRTARGSGIAGCLASWGYTSDVLIEAARREGFPILSLAAIERLD